MPWLCFGFLHTMYMHNYIHFIININNFNALTTVAMSVPKNRQSVDSTPITTIVLSENKTLPSRPPSTYNSENTLDAVSEYI